MTKLSTRITVCCLFGIAALATALGQNPFSVAGIADPNAPVSFLNGMERAVESDNIDWIAERIAYPITAETHTRRLRLRNAGEFKAHYREITTSTFKCALSAQKPTDLEATWQGVMVGRGIVWFARIAGRDGLWITSLSNTLVSGYLPQCAQSPRHR
jgi:hypothetical protein